MGPRAQRGKACLVSQVLGTTRVWSGLAQGLVRKIRRGFIGSMLEYVLGLNGVTRLLLLGPKFRASAFQRLFKKDPVRKSRGPPHSGTFSGAKTLNLKPQNPKP